MIILAGKGWGGELGKGGEMGKGGRRRVRE